MPISNDKNTKPVASARPAAETAVQAAVDVIRNGGVLVYPTETLYAVGCDAFRPEAAARVAEIKGRPEHKPLPVVVGGLEALALLTDDLPPDLERLARRFWPGPLSILVRARRELPLGVRDAAGFVSVRWTAHPLAAELCRRAAPVLVATSANRSGHPAAAVPDELDPALLRGVDTALLERPWPAGGEPSTVIRNVAPGRVEILRHGAISAAALAELLTVLPDPA